MDRLLWITDAHLDHLSDAVEDAWFEKCGHTHSDGIWKNRNITCHTAASAYGRIDHSGMITLGETVSFRRTDC